MALFGYLVEEPQPQFGVFMDRPFVNVVFGLDRPYTSFRQKDDRVRWLCLEVHERYCRVNIANDRGCGPPSDLDISSLKIDVSAVAEGGLSISAAMGLAVRGRPGRPVIWQGDDSPGEWFIGIKLG